jgi:hypothetical protein
VIQRCKFPPVLLISLHPLSPGLAFHHLNQHLLCLSLFMGYTPEPLTFSAHTGVYLLLLSVLIVTCCTVFLVFSAPHWIDHVKRVAAPNYLWILGGCVTYLFMIFWEVLLIAAHGDLTLIASITCQNTSSHLWSHHAATETANQS